MDDTSAPWGLLLAFDSNEEEFCRGFEAGRLWEMVKNPETEWPQTIHANNAEMAIRMFESLEKEFRAELLTDEWVEIHVD